MAAAPRNERLARLEADLTSWIEALRVPVSALEAFRARQQLQARQDEGRPMDAATAKQVAVHLRSLLHANADYRVLVLLEEALAQLRLGYLEPTRPAFAPAEPTAVSQAEPSVPEAAAPPLPDLPVAAAAELPHQFAALAVAAMFSQTGSQAEARAELGPGSAGPTPHAAAPAKQTETRENPPRNEVLPQRMAESEAGQPLAQTELAAKMAADVAPQPAGAAEISSQPLATIQTGPAFDLVDDAQAGVLASVEKLRTTPALRPGGDLAAPTAQPSEIAAAAAPVPASIPAYGTTIDGTSIEGTSIEGTMANVALAVAATVAAAGRISVPAVAPARGKPTGFFTANQPYTPPANKLRSSQPPRVADGGTASFVPPASANETADIRFVVRQASPVLDAMPRAMQLTARPVRPLRDTGAEEASVEIRVHGDDGPAREPEPSVDSQRGLRGAKVIVRVVKALTRPRT